MNKIALSQLQAVEEHIRPLRERLASHPLYASIRTKRHLQLFLQSHVFAVWDFMSLLKALQLRLTCTTVPWTPTIWPTSRRFINEIVLGEESDLYHGRAISHFEIYLEAMCDCGADTAPIQAVVTRARETLHALDAAPVAARAFVRETFATIERDNLHEMAAAFTFGREDVIPDLFRALVRDLNSQLSGGLDKFVWYLERHIEVDGEDHGPLALRMVSDLCGSDERLWNEAARAAESALTSRLALWDGILHEISQNR